jgi:6-pyruvoyltetrahydropterin/6-carboxytetrahydropterin synthase
MQEYRYKFYLNLMHSIQIDNFMGEVHPHTWEIVVDIFKQNNAFITFSEIEKMVDEFLRPFQNKNINDIPPFDAINPTLENVTIYLQKELGTLFVSKGFIMSRIAVSETPSRTFIIDIAYNSPSNEIGNFDSYSNSELVEHEAKNVLTRLKPAADLQDEEQPDVDQYEEIPPSPGLLKGFIDFFKKHWIPFVTAMLVLSSCYLMLVTRG